LEILDYARFVDVVKDASALGAKIICLSGGEPFLHSRIADMVEFVASLGMQTYIYTSGIIFDKSNRKAPLDNEVLHRISSKVTKLIFNIEAATSDTYDEIMGTSDCFEKMKQSIRNADSFCIAAEAHFVPMKPNISETRDVIELCKELNISKLSFLRLVLHGRAQENASKIALTKEETLAFKEESEALKRQSKINIRIGVPLSNDSSCNKCEAANGKLNIKYDGNVYPCEVFKNDRISHSLAGTYPESIHDKALLEIYQQSPYLKKVRDLSNEFSCGSHCETCVGQYLINKDGEHNV
jgi:MoaA/NifB/PqqE/SkfB family radical SAM enzyme